MVEAFEWVQPNGNQVDSEQVLLFHMMGPRGSPWTPHLQFEPKNFFSMEECVLHAGKPDQEHNVQSEQERRGRGSPTKSNRDKCPGLGMNCPMNDETYQAQ